MASWRPRSWPIFVSLLVLCALAAVVPLLLSGALTIPQNRGVIEDEARKYLSRSAASIAVEIRNFVRSYAGQVRKVGDSMKVAAAVATDDVDPFFTMGERGLVEEYRSQDPEILAVHVIGQEGRGGKVQPAELDPAVVAEMQRLAREALSGSLPSGTVSVSELYRLEQLNDYALLFTYPVETSSKEVIGVVEVLVSLRSLLQVLIDEGRRGQTAYVVDSKGRVLLHSDPSVALMRPNRADDEMVAEFIRAPKANSNKSYRTSWGGRERRVIGSLAAVGDEIPWGVIVERDEATAFAVIDQVVRRTVAVGVVALILAVAGAALFARLLSQPIQDLAEKSREMAAGNYGQRVEIRTGNEIGELAATFNHMSEELEKQMEDLRRAARQNHDLFLSSIRCLAAAIDAKDPYTRGHSERVCRYSILIAKHMALSRDEVGRIRVSALLHDVGKIGIDDRILRKPAALTDDEFEVMKQHPSKGAAIMESIPELADVIPGMKYHHEKWEGGGYPDGLKGEDIPMQARIVAVADTFDAMTTTRPYQKAMELSYVISKIRSFAGTRFDPRVVEALVRAYEKGDIALDDATRSLA